MYKLRVKIYNVYIENKEVMNSLDIIYIDYPDKAVESDFDNVGMLFVHSKRYKKIQRMYNHTVNFWELPLYDCWDIDSTVLTVKRVKLN